MITDPGVWDCGLRFFFTSAVWVTICLPVRSEISFYKCGLSVFIHRCFFVSFKKKNLWMKIFLSKKASEYKFPIICWYFFLHFQHFFTIEFFFQFSKKNFVDKFFSNLLQDEPKNKIFNLKTKIIKKNKNLSIEFFFQFQKKKNYGWKYFYQIKQVNISFPSSSDSFFYISIIFLQ